jgi:hypothetical protein
MDREGGVSDGEAVHGDAEAWSALAARWPRQLIAEGRGERLARWWLDSQAAAVAAGHPPFARASFALALADELFEARRARRLVRGLEGAAQQLAAEQAGLPPSPPPDRPAELPRISRLLVVSEDGSERFYRQINNLKNQYSNRLEVLVVACDESELGRASFGGDRRARAVLLDHKDSVIRLLARLDRLLLEESADTGSSSSSSEKF